MKHLDYFSDVAWLEAFIEHPMWSDYLSLAWIDVDSAQKLKFVFTDNAGDSFATLKLCHGPIGHVMRIYIGEDVCCGPKGFIAAVMRDGHVGAIDSLLRLMYEVEERIMLMREAASRNSDDMRVRSILGFEYTHFKFLAAERDRLQDICAIRHLNTRRTATFGQG